MLVAIGQVFVAIILLAGCLLALLAAVGMHRFPDVFCRMHAATKPATLGLVLVALAASASISVPGDGVKLGLVILLQFLTAPVGAHMVGRTAYRSGSPLSGSTIIDELGRDPNVDVYGPSR